MAIAQRRARKSARRTTEHSKEWKNEHFPRCPICSMRISRYSLARHAAGCMGPDSSRPTRHSRPEPQELIFIEDSSAKDDTEASSSSASVVMLTSPPGAPEPVTGSSGSSADGDDPLDVKPSLDSSNYFLDGIDNLPPKRQRKEVIDMYGDDDGEEMKMRALVENSLSNARSDRADMKSQLLNEQIKRKNEMMMRLKKTQKKSPPLPYHLETGVDMELRTFEGVDELDGFSMPRSTSSVIFLKTHFHEEIDDKESDKEDESSHAKEEDPDETPFTGTSKKFSSKKLREFNSQDLIGAGYEMAETQDDIQVVLKSLDKTTYDKTEARAYLAYLLQEDTETITTQFTKMFLGKKKEPKNKVTYEDIMSSFRDLFCRRCFGYDCNLHGLADKYDPDLQADLALRKEYSGHWKAKGFDDDGDESSMASSGNGLDMVVSSPRTKKVFLNTERVMIMKFLTVFNGDPGTVASLFQCTPSDVMDLAPTAAFAQCLPINGSNQDKNFKQAMTYNQTWLKRIIETTSRPFFFPCHHVEPCSEETCTCIQNGFFCTKHCVWGSASRNFFRGCNCSGRCNAKSCPCFASNRECDPDLCKTCGACTDPPNKPVKRQNCTNDNISMRRHAHTLLGKSDVSGWGLFNKFPLQKGDFVIEYLGEVIPHEEAERRGQIYDARNETYLFDLSTDYAVDAFHKGNKARYINHSEKPNVVPRLCSVNGDNRIGFYAKVDIEAQTELFFDYGKMFFSEQSKFVNLEGRKAREDW